MIRLLHFADLHLGVEAYGRLDPQTGLSSRMGDFLGALDEVVDCALQEGVDLVLFCGDAYKSRDPSQTQQREFARRIGRLSAAGIPVFLLVGNHDLPNALARANAVEIFDTLGVQRVYVAARPGTHRIETKGGPLQIVALPWVTRSHLLSREEYKNASLEELNGLIQEKLANVLEGQIERLDDGLPTILAAHVALPEAKVGSERMITLGREHVLLRSNLAQPAFDYVALGHMHEHQHFGGEPPLVYAGSLQSIDFGEEGERKGFCLVEIKQAGRERRVSWEFREVRNRRFLTIAVDADTLDPMQTVLRAISRREEEVKDAIVRLQIRTSAEGEAQIQEGEVRRALSEAHNIASIEFQVKREHRTRLAGRAAEGLTPLEYLKLYLEERQTPQERAQVLMEYAEGLMQPHPEEG